MKTRLLTLLILVFAACFAHAQQSLKIGHVNVQELAGKHPLMDSIRSVIEKETEEMQKIYEEMMTEHESKLKAFEKEGAGMSDFVKTTKQNELIELAQKIQAYNQNAQQQLQQRNMELIRPVYENINQEITTIAGQQHFSYILDISTGCAAYISPESEDITPQVLEKIKTE